MYNTKLYSEEFKVNEFIKYAANYASIGLITLLKSFFNEYPYYKFKNYNFIVPAVLKVDIGNKINNCTFIYHRYCVGLPVWKLKRLVDELDKLQKVATEKKKKQQPKKINKSVSASFTFHFKVGSLVVYKNRYTDTVYIVIHTGNHTVNLRIIYSPNLHSIGTPYYGVDIDKLELFQGTCTITSEHKCTVEQVVKTKVLQ